MSRLFLKHPWLSFTEVASGNLNKNEDYSAQTIYPKTSLYADGMSLGIYPDNADTQALMGHLQPPFGTIKLFNDAEALHREVEVFNLSTAVLFDSNSDWNTGKSMEPPSFHRKPNIAFCVDAPSFPGKVSYSIRQMPTSRISGDNSSDVWHVEPNTDDPDAFLSDIVPVQYYLDIAILKQLGAGAYSFLSMDFQQFPSLSYSVNRATQALQYVLPIYLTLIFTVQVRVLLTRVLEDKETKIKEASECARCLRRIIKWSLLFKQIMKIMGLRDMIYWLSWFITAGT